MSTATPIHFADGFDEPDTIAFGLAAPQMAAVACSLLLTWSILRGPLPPVAADGLATLTAGVGALLGWGRWAGRPLTEWAWLAGRFALGPRNGGEPGIGIVLAEGDPPTPKGRAPRHRWTAPAPGGDRAARGDPPPRGRSDQSPPHSRGDLPGPTGGGAPEDDRPPIAGGGAPDDAQPPIAGGDDDQLPIGGRGDDQPGGGPTDTEPAVEDDDGGPDAPHGAETAAERDANGEIEPPWAQWLREGRARRPAPPNGPDAVRPDGGGGRRFTVPGRRSHPGQPPSLRAARPSPAAPAPASRPSATPIAWAPPPPDGGAPARGGGADTQARPGPSGFAWAPPPRPSPLDGLPAAAEPAPDPAPRPWTALMRQLTSFWQAALQPADAGTPGGTDPLQKPTLLLGPPDRAVAGPHHGAHAEPPGAVRGGSPPGPVTPPGAVPGGSPPGTVTPPGPPSAGTTALDERTVELDRPPLVLLPTAPRADEEDAEGEDGQDGDIPAGIEPGEDPEAGVPAMVIPLRPPGALDDDLVLELADAAPAAARVSDSAAPPESGADPHHLGEAPVFVGATRRVVFFSLNGGSGRTTLATEVATLLAARGRHRAPDGSVRPLRVALVDLDLRSANVAVRVGIPQPTLLDYLLNSPDDPERLDRYLVTHPTGLRVLLGPPKPLNGATALQPATVAEIVHQLERLGHHFVVIDVCADINAVTTWVLSNVHDIFVVITPNASGIQDAYRSTEALRRLGLGHKLRYVVNRVREPVDLDDVMADLRGRVAATIPYDPRVEEAENRHRCAALEGGGPAADALFRLAASLYPGLLPARRRGRLGALLRRRVG